MKKTLCQSSINPVSLGLCFDNGKFSNYRAETVMPTFLIDILKSRPLDFSCVDIEEPELSNYEPTDPKGVTLLYQTGYLTIDTFRQRGASRRYTLKLPNLEVENSLYHSHLKSVPSLKSWWRSGRF